MTAAIIATVAAGVVVVALLAHRRASARSDRRFEAVLEQLDEHMSAISESLEHVVERSVEVKDSGVGELELTLNLGELLQRVAAEAASRTGADAASVRVRGPNDAPLTVSLGGPDGSSLLEATLRPPDARPFQALTIDWTYGQAAESDAETYRSALIVPIDEGGVTTGAIAAYARARHAFRSEQTRALQTLAEQVAPGVTNARRFARAEQRAATDELTGARNRRGYEAELEREVARAGRTGRPLSLLVLDLDVPPERTGRRGARDPDAELREFTALVTRVTRATDVICRRGTHEFAVLLPETQPAGAQTLFSRLRHEVATATFTHGAPTMVSAGLVDWRPHETSQSLDARVMSAATRVTGEGSEPHDATAKHESKGAGGRAGGRAQDDQPPPSRLATRQTFLDRLAHEVGRSHREAGPLSLVVLDVGGLRPGAIGADRVLADVATRLDDTVSDEIVSCRTRENELAILLPDTTANGAENALATLQASLRQRPPVGIDRLVVSAGVTELTETDDSGSVFGRAEQALWQARQAGDGTVVVATANGEARP